MISHLTYSDFVFEINTFQQLLKYNKFTTHLLECNLYRYVTSDMFKVWWDKTTSSYTFIRKGKQKRWTVSCLSA